MFNSEVCESSTTQSIAVDPSWKAREDIELRLRALQMALDSRTYEDTPALIVARAKKFAAYLIGPASK